MRLAPVIPPGLRAETADNSFCFCQTVSAALFDAIAGFLNHLIPSKSRSFGGTQHAHKSYQDHLYYIGHLCIKENLYSAVSNNGSCQGLSVRIGFGMIAESSSSTIRKMT
jgi:hypothetical protein